MEVRVSRASAVIVQRAPAASVEWFLEWQNGVTAVASTFAGYQGTDVYSPTEPDSDEWVVVVHFSDDASLRRWLDSPVRAEWVARVRAKLGEFRLETLHGGFGFWFAGGHKPGALPPSWKMVVAVLLALYPTAMLLTFNQSYTAPLGLAASMLINCAISVSLLQWIVMPRVTALLRPWLDPKASPAVTIGGFAGLLLLLVAMAAAFRQATG